jgi:hypothetical protein
MASSRHGASQARSACQISRTYRIQADASLHPSNNNYYYLVCSIDISRQWDYDRATYVLVLLRTAAESERRCGEYNPQASYAARF